MKDISVIIIPSVYKEVFPLVMQLGLAYKKPIIASKIGGLTDVIKDGENGLLFEIGNIEELTKILQQIKENPELVKKIKTNIKSPPRIEEEAFVYELVYNDLKQGF